MASTQNRATDPWPQERDGYYQPPPVAYAAVASPARNRAINGTLIRRAEQLGSLVAGAGIIWTAYAVVHHADNIIRFAVFPPGPVETLGAGVLIWLVAKWCRAAGPR